MSFVIGILTFILVLNCFFLILLVLVQLPKKDAGAGMAFGAGTADALFGAGSGNALTKITKYSAVVFLALTLVLGWLQSSVHADATGSAFAQKLQQATQQAPTPTPVATQPVTGGTPTAPAGGLLSAPGALTVTNATTPAGK